MAATADLIRADVLSQFSRFTALHRRFLDGTPATQQQQQQQPPPLLWHATHFDTYSHDQFSVMPANLVVLSYHRDPSWREAHAAPPASKPDLESIDVVMDVDQSASCVNSQDGTIAQGTGRSSAEMP